MRSISRNATLWLVVGGAVVAVFAWAFYANAVDEGRAQQLALQEVRNRAEPDERIEAWTYASQRHWWDYYRATYGALAATDRRLLFVGVQPELYSLPDNPPLFDIQSIPYDTGLAVATGPVMRGWRRGAVVRARGETHEFAVRSAGWTPLARVTRAATAHVLALRERLRREERYRDSLAALPPVRELYRVKPGDALEAIARRYDTSPDSLRALNHLSTDRIRVGQELLVRVTPVPITPCPPSVCDVSVSAGGEILPESDRTRERSAP